MEQTGRRSTAASCFFHTQSPYFAVPHRRAGRLAAALLVGADAPGRLLLPLRGNSPSALIGPPHRLCRGGPCGRPQAGVGTRPYKPVFSPFPYSHPPGWPRLPLQGNLSSVRIGPLGGDKPRPYAAAAGRARAKGHAAGYACGVSSSSSVFFVSLWLVSRSRSAFSVCSRPS